MPNCNKSRASHTSNILILLIYDTNNNSGVTDEAQGKNIMVDGDSTEKLVSPS
jgi:hypothetical protein